MNGRGWLAALALAALCIFLSACQARAAGAAQAAKGAATFPASNPSGVTATAPDLSAAALPSTPLENAAPLAATSPAPVESASPTLLPTATPIPPLTEAGQSAQTPSQAAPTLTTSAIAQTDTPSPTPAPVDPVRLPYEDWKQWPVIPQVPLYARTLYQQGLALGNDPHAFSILGDCQSLPETFMGVYDTDTTLVAGLPPELQAVVANFAGSFNRQSPTVKGGTTAGAILWDAWHENKFTCQTGETPLDCELRIHKPSIVIINLGTHYETRNIIYLRKILDRLIAQGVVPILATKADNRELDERLNLEAAQLAVEYNVPLWNFWAAVSDLPNNGVGVKKGEEFLGDIYLSDAGLERHRYTALQTLETVWVAVK